MEYVPLLPLIGQGPEQHSSGRQFGSFTKGGGHGVHSRARRLRVSPWHGKHSQGLTSSTYPGGHSSHSVGSDDGQTVAFETS